jgi:SPP1 gp7 family putative phage head morphogenesis protein
MNKFDVLVEAREKTRNKTKKRKVKTSRMRGYPLGVEKSYTRELTKIAKKVNKAITQAIMPDLKKIRDNAQRELGLKKDAYENELDDVFKTARAAVVENLDDNTLKRIAEKHGLDTSDKNLDNLRNQFKSVAGVDIIGSEPFLGAKVRAFVAENTRLIKGMADDALKRVEGAVYRGVTRGESLKTITDNVQKATNSTVSKAKLIARDQVSSLNSELTKIRQKENGLKKYIWSTSLDERVRDDHERNEGQIFSWDNPPSTGHPGEEIQCRCVALPVFD